MTYLPHHGNWPSGSPRSKVISDEQIIFNDPEIQAVGLFALADSRPEQIQKAIASGKHVIAEKPIADTVEKEWQTVALAEKAKIFSTVNLYLRNSWYHNTIKDFIAQGEIGELAIIRVCHMTPGLAPGEGHEFEGPSFHDCGMHYVDIARWYAESEFKTWNAQAIRMWDYKDPWWLQCHGTFENGIVFDITQGHVYGQLAEKQTHNSYIDIIGTKGIARMTHDFKTAIVELHGVTQTHRLIQPYGGKNIDVLCKLFAESIESGKRNPSLLVPRRRHGIGIRMAVSPGFAAARPAGNRKSGNAAGDPRTPPHDVKWLRIAEEARISRNLILKQTL